MCTSRCGSLNGRPRRNKSLIKLKIAVFSPMPSASVRTAIKVNPGDFRSCRRAKRISANIKASQLCGSFVTERSHRIDARRASRGNETRRRGHEREQSRDGEINGWIERVDLEQNIFQRSCGQDSEQQRRATRAKHKTDDELPCALSHHHSENSRCVRAECHSNSELLGTLVHRKTHHPIETDGRQHKGDCAKNHEQIRDDSVATKERVV